MKVWSNIKSKIFSWDTLAYLLVIIYIVIFVFLTFGRHDSLKTYLNDLGTYDQIVWNSLHGRLFQTSGGIYATSDNFSYLSGHFSPILLILVPFYLIWANPKMLLLLQVLAVGVAALPIYWIARDKIKSKLAGLIFLISYLFYPILHNALMYDFHEVTLAVPFITFALYFWQKKKYLWMSIFLVLICLSQEHLTLIVFMFGLYLMFTPLFTRRSESNQTAELSSRSHSKIFSGDKRAGFINKKWKMGSIIAFLSLAYFLLVITVIMPAFSVTHGVDVIKSPSGGITRYSWLGSSTGEIAKTIVSKPFWVLQNIFSWRRIDFFITLFIPLLGLPLFSATVLLALPVLLIYFLSSFWLTYSIYYYHSAPLTGIIYFAAIFSFARLIKAQKYRRLFLILILIASILVSYFYTITPLAKYYSWSDYKPSVHAKIISEVKKIIPNNASLSVQHNLGPHFTDRRQLYSLPKKIGEADYILIDVYNPYYGESDKQFFGLRDILAKPLADWAKIIEDVFNDARYGLIYDNDGYFIFQKGASQDLNVQGFFHFTKLLDEIVNDLKENNRL